MDDNLCTCHQYLPVWESGCLDPVLCPLVLVSSHGVPLESIYISKDVRSVLDQEECVCPMVAFRLWGTRNRVKYAGIWALQLALLGAKKHRNWRRCSWRDYYLPSDGVWAANHGRLHHSWVFSKGAFHFKGPDPVAGRAKQSLPRHIPSPRTLRREKERADSLTLRN